LLKNGATPNFVEFKDENENVVASISTSGDLNVAGSITVNGSEVGATGPAGADGGWSTAQTLKEESGTSYTIQSSDVGKLIIFTSQDPVSVTVPWSLGFSIGQRVDIFQRYNGQITVSGGAGPMPGNMVFVLGTPGNKTRTALSAATLVYINSNVSGPEYALIGDLSA
jgi:hypothetical protein